MTSVERPLVSVVVPVYNVECYLAECVESLLSQTYENLEILLVDDGSTDTSGAMCDCYAIEHSNVVAMHKSNGGLSDARNYGVERCGGDYVAFVDSDDYVSPAFIEVLMSAVEECECPMAAFPFATPFDDGGSANLCRTLGDARKMGQAKKLAAKDYIDMLLRHECDTNAMFWVYPKELLLRHPFPLGMTFEDAATVYRIVHDAGSVAVVPITSLYAYRQRKGSIMHSSADRQMVESAIEIGRQVEGDMKAWYPDGWASACSCGFSINRVALMRTTLKQKEYRAKLWAEICHYRKGLLEDRAAKPVKRAAAALSYLGSEPFLALSRVFEKVRGGNV